jgi:hypothetical protein
MDELRREGFIERLRGRGPSSQDLSAKSSLPYSQDSRMRLESAAVRPGL